MPKYVPEATHPFLSPAARALGEEELAIYADEAEAVLGLVDSNVTEEGPIARLKGAVARQISTLVEFDPVSVLLMKETRGARSREFRASQLPVNPLAKLTVDQVLGVAPSSPSSGYGVLTSHRGRTVTPERTLTDDVGVERR